MRTRPFLAPRLRAVRARTFVTWGRRGRVAVALLLAAAGACGKEDVESELDRVRSWVGTTTLAADRRAAGAIDRAVARQLADRAAKADTESTESLGKLAASDSERAAASALLDSLRLGITRLRAVAR